ncbi:hypothetical protein NCAS_0C05380 [Naumovozyma castellii]|uniref:type II protein arginine methyltransferase n=1 Tax=Naumovozyma castellii TaxID=27288 RepID=G0VDG6_NAUCA|nr:hypothetical protein NCAS_0C05380 [Naumovozyma castellii CBS 4309]CCC69528.1 hypothetical protein NCAS_0C05380 [Naumovozyma castellii CBS 4309]
MRIFPINNITHVRFKATQTLPLLSIEELRKSKSLPLTKGTFTLPMRDYIEWENIPKIMKRETFFTNKNTLKQSMDSFQQYDPILTQCLAKWLLVNYKLNDYPYFDLNIVNVCTDLKQGIQICKTIMQYYKANLSDNIFERIKYYLVPLYETDLPSRADIEDIPGFKQFISREFVFESTEMNGQIPFSIEDPVYLLLLDDILKYTAHDLVRYCPKSDTWEQGFIDINVQGGKRKRFDTDIDYWCRTTLQVLKENDILPTLKANEEIYIPTGILRLFKLMELYLPEHRLFAVDSPQRWNPGLMTMLKLIFKGTIATQSSKIKEKFKDSMLTRGSVPIIEFVPDFLQIQKLYEAVHLNSSKDCEIEEVEEFINKWTDIGKEGSVVATKKTKAKLKLLKNSQLAILRSS